MSLNHWSQYNWYWICWTDFLGSMMLAFLLLLLFCFVSSRCFNASVGCSIIATREVQPEVAFTLSVMSNIMAEQFQ